MHAVYVYYPGSQQPVTVSLEDDATFGQVRGTCSRVLRSGNAGISLYVRNDCALCFVDNKYDNYRLNNGRYAATIFFAVPTEQGYIPINEDPLQNLWETRYTDEKYSILLQYLRTGEVKEVSISKTGRLSDLYKETRAKLNQSTSDEPLYLTTSLSWCPILPEGHDLTRNVVPRDSVVYVCHYAFELNLFSMYEEVRLPLSQRVDVQRTARVGLQSQIEESINPGINQLGLESQIEENINPTINQVHECSLVQEAKADTVTHAKPTRNDKQKRTGKKRSKSRKSVSSRKRVSSARIDSIPLERMDENVRPNVMQHIRVNAEDTQLAPVEEAVNENMDSPTRDTQGDRCTRQSVQRRRRISAEEEENVLSEDTDDANLLEDQCCNCKRTKPFGRFASLAELLPYKIHLIKVNLSELRLRNRRRFCFVDTALYESGDNRVQQATICGQCYLFLYRRRPNDPVPEPKTDSAAIWPAFVWEQLSSESSYEEAWSLLPAEWRAWWIRSLCDKHHCSEQVMLDLPSLFTELSVEVDRDMKALEGLVWHRDLMPRELSFVKAEVKCPAGCSEFKHKAKQIPFDIVWEWHMERELNLYSNRGNCVCSNWFRKDYFTVDRLLWNNDWLCKPSIAYCSRTLTPVVLTCRFHTVKNKTLMLHPCRHPSGSISTGKASQFTPVVPIPRTLRKAMYSTYAASFHIAKMQGSFQGLDTMFLCSNGGYPFYESKLAWEQECAAFRGRADLRAHIGKYVSGKNRFSTVLPAFENQNFYNVSEWKGIKERFARGSTYISVDDSVDLQQTIFYAQKETTRMPSTEEHPGGYTVQYHGGWPSHLVFVHPSFCCHGARPFIPPFFTTGLKYHDGRVSWMLCSMLLSVPELWVSVTKAYKPYLGWEGWVLTYLTSKCLPHMSKKGKESPFKVTTQAHLVIEHGLQKPCGTFDPMDLYKKFHPLASQKRNYDNILRCWNDFPARTKIDKNINIIIVIRKPTARRGAGIPRFLKRNISGWELRYIALSEPSPPGKSANKWHGSIYLRHGGRNHFAWWRIPKGSHYAEKKSRDWVIGDLGQFLKNWNVCVYVKITPIEFDVLRTKVLGACGGQSKGLCAIHQVPLITVLPRREYVCCYSMACASTCKKTCTFACPVHRCVVSVCKKHLQMLDNRSEVTTLDAIDEEDYKAVVLSRPPRYDRDEEATRLSGQSKQSERNTIHILKDSPLTGDGFMKQMEGGMVQDMDNIFASGFHVGFDDVAYFDNDSVGESDADESCIPTTDASQDPIFASIEQGDVSTSTMTNHALLNCYGSCLVRRSRKLSGTIAQRSFMQKLVAGEKGSSIPLVYPEAMLFSDVFFSDNNNGSILGAVPAGLLHSDSVLREYGMASLLDTYRTRMMSPGLLTSTNPKYHFWAFDALANFSMRGCDSRIILRRGFAELQDSGGVRLRGAEEPIFDSEHVECRSLVNRISASVGERFPTYFYTHTCSMKTHFGMRLLWDWLISDELQHQECRETTVAEIQYWKQSLIDSAGSYLLRVWMELIEIWLLYISKSPEQPAGPVDQYIARMEFQGNYDPATGTPSRGNLPHMHALLWTKDDLNCREGLLNAIQRIRGSVSDIVQPEEEQSYVDRGIFGSKEEIEDFRDTMKRFLNHKHNRRCFVLQKNPSTGEHELKKVCKVANNWVLSSSSGQHTFNKTCVNHSQEAIKVMIDIGVAKDTQRTFDEHEILEFIPLVDFLKSDKHIPPCCGEDGIMSPVIGILVAINPNSDNCQLANGYFVARYLAKYVIKIDEYHVINIRPPAPDVDNTSFPVESQFLHNTKITSNRLQQKKELDKGHSTKKRTALGINVCDVYMKVFNYPTVYTNLRHVRFATDTYENRAARMRRQKPIDGMMRANPNLQAHALSAVQTVPAHHARDSNPLTPNWQQFTENQVKKAFDDLFSPLSMDPVTLFGMRPPELRFVMHQRNFHRWFKCENLCRIVSDKERVQRKLPVTGLVDQMTFCARSFTPGTRLYKNTWIAASSHLIRVRLAALNEVSAYLESAPLTYFDSAANVAAQIKSATIEMFERIKKAARWYYRGISPSSWYPLHRDMQNHYQQLCDRFICEPTEQFLPTPWTTAVRPTQTVRFLIHLLLSYGAFVDEYSLFQSGSLRQAFIAAGLIDTNDLPNSARRLMQLYFVKELKILPAGTPTFDRYTCAAYNIIRDFITQNTFFTDELPTVLYCRLKHETTASCVAFAERRKQQLVATVHAKLQQAAVSPLPSVEAFMNATIHDPLDWNICALHRPRGQPMISYEEQQSFFQKARDQIEAYINPSRSCPQGLCLVGGGGVGKTTSALICLLYARSRGLTINATALVSERAQELGVPHLNNDFAIPKVDLGRLTPGQIAERTISGLYRKPEHLEFHRTVDVELVDEMGPIAAEIWSARDIALRYIRNSNKPNGGKLDFVTFDHLQSYPIQGTHPLLSPFVTSTYRYFKLSESVRAAASLPWQRIQAISRMTPQQLAVPTIEAEFVKLLTQHCNFVDSPDQVPAGSLFVYGKNAPVRALQRRLEQQLARKPNVVVSVSDDQECNFEGRFIKAQVSTSKSLDRKLREQQRLYLYKGAKYRITFNKPGVHSNGQLAFMHEHPSEQHVRSGRPLPVLVSPPGCGYLPGADDTSENLQQMGWTLANIGYAPENVIYIRNMKAKRSSQYGLQLYVGSTWHSTMGRTLAKLATRVEPQLQNGGLYAIWEATQVVIMLSRTKLPEDTTYISKNPVETAKLLYRVLKKESPFRAYLSYLLSSLCENTLVQGSVPRPSLDQSRSIYRPKDVLLPSDNTGFVYILISTADMNFLYIGSCLNLLTRYASHNSGYGSQQTAPASLRPWAMLAYVAGFEASKPDYLDFENRWIARRLQLQRTSPSSVSIEAVLELGETITQEFCQDRGLALRFVHSGTITKIRDIAQPPIVLSSTDSDAQSSSDNNSSDPDFEYEFLADSSERGLEDASIEEDLSHCSEADGHEYDSDSSVELIEDDEDDDDDDDDSE